MFMRRTLLTAFTCGNARMACASPASMAWAEAVVPADGSDTYICARNACCSQRSTERRKLLTIRPMPMTVAIAIIRAATAAVVRLREADTDWQA